MKAGWKRLSGKHRRHNFLSVLGHINLDVVYELERFPVKGQSINTGRVKELFGGTAGNIALHSAALGVSTAVGCYVGEDLSGEFRQMLLDANIDCYDVIVVDGERTPRCHVFDTPDGEQTYIIEQGAMSSSRKLPLWEASVKSSSIVHVATGDPDRYLKAVSGRDYCFDPGQEISYRYTKEKFGKLLDGASIFFTNTVEMRMALKLTGSKNERELTEHCKTVIKTTGSKGTTIVDADGTETVPPCRVKKVVDTIGAGDAFRAGFYAAKEKGYGMVKCVQFGNAMASIAIEGVGGTGSLATFNSLERRWKDNYS